MKTFESIPDLSAQLAEVSVRAKDITYDSLLRQPLSRVLEDVFSAPGKQLRPALLLLFGRIGSDYPDCEEQLITAGAIVELTHMASLIHDDIVDDSPSRRGRPTLHSLYGKDMAVYAGDYLLSQVLSQLMDPNMLAAGRVLSKSIADMCSGELGQYTSQFDVQTDESRYFMNISGKTAALFSASCEIGAVISGCSKQTTNFAARFGHSLGVIFQLRDDLIDCIPGRREDEKKHGLDFINGIYTLPVIYSFKDAEHGPQLRTLAGSSSSLDPKVLSKELYKHISAAGGIDYTRWSMKQYRARALNNISQLPSAKVKEQLTALLDEIMDF